MSNRTPFWLDELNETSSEWRPELPNGGSGSVFDGSEVTSNGAALESTNSKFVSLDIAEAVRVYWEAKLAGSEHIELATDAARVVPIPNGADECPLTVPIALKETLEHRSRETGVGISTWLMSVWATLIFRYTGVEDFVLGVDDTLDRLHPSKDAEGDEAVSDVGETLPIRCTPRSSLSFGEFASGMERLLAEGKRFGSPGSERLSALGQSYSGRAVSESSSIHYRFQPLRGTVPADSQTASAMVGFAEPSRATTRWDWSLELYETDSGIILGQIVYRNTYWRRATIERLAGHFLVLLEASLANPQAFLSDMSLMTSKEWNQVVVEWNQTEIDYPRDLCIHDLFEAQARRTPDAIAIVCGSVRWSYRELDVRSSALAAHLRVLGVAPRTLVGLCLDPSPEVVLAILGILKAGAAYVPVDPRHPKQRIEAIARVADIPFLVTLASIQERLPIGIGQPVLIDGWRETPIEVSKWKTMESVVDSEQLAYVLFTSGSTGAPKGVAVRHVSVVNFLLAMAIKPGLRAGERLLSVTSPTFDISVMEMLLPLIVGATVEIVPREWIDDPAALAEALSRSRADMMQATPTTWQMMLLHGWTGHPGLRIVTGGEALSDALSAQLLERCAELWNQYGPTEATVYATQYRVPVDGPRGKIGRPIPNSQCYVLDKNRNPLPVGVPGELHVSGVLLAREYLNRPDLTAERFVGNPFSSDLSSLMYRTGDLCRWCEDGELEYLGRLDQQVKLRGFRIELQEIESALLQLPDVAQAVVVLREDEPGQKRLVGYGVMASGVKGAAGPPSYESIAERLRLRLPDYMVPSVVVWLASIPQTTSGKTDRSALPKPDEQRPDLRVEYTPPGDALQRALAGIYSSVLGVPRVGIHDSFLALGGHSLLAVMTMVRTRDLLGIPLRVRNVFDYPTVATLAEFIQSEFSDRWVSCDFGSDGTGNTGPVECALEPAALKEDRVEYEDGHPLSFAQLRLWLVDQMEGSLSAYNIPQAWRLRGPLDLNALQQGFDEILRRHASLRTTYHALEGEPRQQIESADSFELTVVEGSLNASEELETFLAQEMAIESERPFRLESDRLIRARLIRVSHHDHVLLVTMHHIASDEWSYLVFQRELGQLYSAAVQGRSAELSASPIEYLDYANWEAQSLQDGRLDSALAYWRNQLQELPPLEVPLDYPRSMHPTYVASSLQLALSPELMQSLRRMSQAHSVTMQMMLLSAFQLLLARLSGQDDFAVATVTAGRENMALHDLIGFFVNTLVMRCDASGNPTFSAFLERVRRDSLDAYDHGALPFNHLVEELQPERHRSRNPLVQVLFQFMEFDEKGFHLEGLKVDSLCCASTRVRFDLELHLTQREDTIVGDLVFSRELFRTATMERFAARYIQLLESIVADPYQNIAHLEILPTSERRRLLLDSNETTVPFPSQQCVHEIFEQQAATFGDRIALVDEAKSWSYTELNEFSNQIARELRDMGVERDQRVAIALPRSADFVVAVLAILKAGGCYVPLDVDYPLSRLKTMLVESEATVILTKRSHLSLLESFEMPAIFMDSDRLQWAHHASTNLVSVSTPSSLAYVIFTSGSTGQPKGVAIEHRSIARLVFGNDYATFGDDRVFFQLASVAFDAATFEIWGALLHGAKLVIAPSSSVMNLSKCSAWIRKHGVTTLWLTASLFNQWIEDDPQGLATVNEILTGGEALSVKHIAMAQRALGDGVQLINGYGPTECTTFAVCYRIPERIPEDWGSIPIGRPIGNTQAYVLDRFLRPVPIGSVGELYLGGDGLARGYLNTPSLTEERFVSVPTLGAGGQRLYRTGDMCRWLEDGVLEYVERADDQVKLRGYRIELGEIEHCLSQHPNVDRAVVLMHQDPSTGPFLSATILPVVGSAVSGFELSQLVRERLPAYMIPAAWVLVDRLPLTTNGKIDRRALSARALSILEESHHASASTHLAPRNEVEKQLHAIWCEVLGTEAVGVRDDFFAKGGHSLTAVRLFARIEKQFGKTLPLALLFQNGTIEQIAMHLQPDQSSDAFATVIPLDTSGRGRNFYLMPSIGGELIYAKPLVERLRGKAPLMGLQGSLRPSQIEQHQDFVRTACLYLSVLREHQPQGPYSLGGFSYGGMLAYEIARQLTEAGQEVELLVVMDTGPAWRNGNQGLMASCRWLGRWLKNLPFWVVDEWRTMDWSQASGRVYRKLRYLWRSCIDRQASSLSYEDVFDVRRIATQNQELMKVLFRAFIEYVPLPLRGKLVLFRARTQPLFHVCAKDYDWSQLVDSVAVISIPGNHDNLLQSPSVDAIATQLERLLGRRHHAKDDGPDIAHDKEPSV